MFRIITTTAAVLAMGLAPAAAASWTHDRHTTTADVAPDAIVVAQNTQLDADKNTIDEPGNIAQDLDRNTDRIRPEAEGTETDVIRTRVPGSPVPGAVGTNLDEDENTIDEPGNIQQDLDRNTDRLEPESAAD